MAAPASTDEFVDLVRKSGVAEDKRVDAFVQQLRTTSALPDNPGKLAGLMVTEGLLTHFQAEQIMLGKWRRFTIGKYKVLERLGSGGMGSVYLCEHKFMRRRVAVKVLPAAKAEDQASLERFYREARAAAALDHPNIVRAYDIDQDENLHFLVMEYVDGASLQEIIKKFGPMNILFACHYVRQAAIGLQHAHEAGLVHRDIKPGNLLVDRTGTVKVLDMGLARFFHDEEDILTKKYDESVLGTADYLAPEQALDSHSVDIRADIYSLGATFYFCLTGSPPFQEGTVAQKLIWHQTRQPKAVKAARPEVPDGIAAIIERMMTKDRAKRYQTPAQVVDALAQWTAKPIQQPPDQWMPRLSPAAMGGMEPGAASVTAATPSPTALPVPVPRPPTVTPAPGRPMAPVAMQPQRPVTPQPVRQAPAPAPQPRPSGSQPMPVQQAQQRILQPGNGAASATEPAPNWGELANSGANPAVRRPVQAVSGNPSVRIPTVVESKFKRVAVFVLSAMLASMKKRPKVWLIAGGVFLLVLVGWIGISALTGPGNAGKTTNQQPPSRRVTVSAGEKADYKTVKDALLKAMPNDRIVVLDETIEEPLNLQSLPNKIANNVTIEGDGPQGKRVVWRPTTPREGQSPQSTQLLSLSNCEGLTIKGFSIQGQNGTHQTLDLVVIFGKCPGLRLEDVQFQGFRRSAVKLINTTGESARPIVLKNLYTGPSADPGNSAALIFEMGGNSVLTSMQHIRVEDCLFEGPYRSSVQLLIGHGCELANVEFQRNRFYRATDGFFYKKPSGKPFPPLTFTLDSNTFFGMERGLLFETMPLDEKSQVIFKNNLFRDVKTLVQVNELAAPAADRCFPPQTSNVRDPNGKEGNLNIKANQVDCGTLIIDQGADKKQLLRYPKNSPLATAGQDKGPVGVPPLE